MRRAGIVAAALAVAGVAAFLWSSHSSNAAAVEPAAAPTAVAPTAAALAPSQQLVAAPRGAAVAAPTVGEEGDGPSMTVKADQVIVRINGVAITGRQVVAFAGAAGAAGEQTMTHEMFEFLRARAIDRELTTQAARAQHVELSAAQLAELDQVRKNASEHGDTDPAQLEFEVAEARAGLLQSALLARAGVTLEAAADPKLADEAQARYSGKLRGFLDDLAARATVADH